MTFKLAQTIAAQTPIVNTLKTYTNSTPKVPHAPACRRQRHTSSPAPAIATPAVVIPTARPTTRLTGASSGSVLTSGEGLGDGVPDQDGETTPGGLEIDWYIRENPVAVPDESVTKRMTRVPSESNGPGRGSVRFPVMSTGGTDVSGKYTDTKSKLFSTWCSHIAHNPKLLPSLQ